MLKMLANNILERNLFHFSTIPKTAHLTILIIRLGGGGRGVAQSKAAVAGENTQGENSGILNLELLKDEFHD